MDWQAIALDFEADGLLRDIHVEETTIADWRYVWVLGFEEDVTFIFNVDGENAEPPRSVDEVFALRANHAVTGSYRVEGITYNCHFFEVSEIEFDVDPSEIADHDGADRLSRFIKRLAYLTGKPVRLTHENLPRAIIALLDPSDAEVRWLLSGAHS